MLHTLVAMDHIHIDDVPLTTQGAGDLTRIQAEQDTQGRASEGGCKRQQALFRGLSLSPSKPPCKCHRRVLCI